MSPSLIALLFLPNLNLAQVQVESLRTTSLFVPVEYVSNTFSASIAGSDATATTYIFPPGCENRPCGPVTVIQGPGTAIFNETDQPITTIYNCTLYPSTADPTSASCTLSSTSPGYDFPSPVTTTFPAGSGYAFPLYRAVITAGSDDDNSDIWGSATGQTSRASLFNPITFRPLTTSSEESESGSSTVGGSSSGPVETSASSTAEETSSGSQDMTMTMPPSTTAAAAASSSTPVSTSTSSTSAARSTIMDVSTQLSIICILVSIFTL